MKKKSIREKKNKLKKKNWKYLKRKKKLVVDVLDAALLCTIHGATVENTLFEDGDDANIFRAFNPNSIIFTFEKNIIINPLWNAD